MASSSTNHQQYHDNPEELSEILIPASQNNVSIARRTLVGKLLTNRAMNHTSAKDVISKAWASYENLQITDLGKNKFMFTFAEEKHCREIMKKSPWFFLNHLMCIQFWISEVAPHEICFDLNAFWIQVHNLPMEYMNCINTTTILQKVGRIVEMEDSIVEGRILKTFMRAKVEIDVTKPLPSGCWVPRRDLPKIWVIYKYERLRDLCYNCGIIGHEQRTCKIPRVMSAYCSSIPKYDQNLSAQVPKSIASQEHKRRYGDSTKDTAKKFVGRKDDSANQPRRQKPDFKVEMEADKKAKEKAKQAWEKMVADCGEIFSPNFLGRRNKPLQVREEPLEGS